MNLYMVNIYISMVIQLTMLQLLYKDTSDDLSK